MPDKPKPDYSHPAFQAYFDRFEENAERLGFENAFFSWAVPQPCACIGPQHDDPHCPCEMASHTASRYGKVVRRDPHESDQ